MEGRGKTDQDYDELEMLLGEIPNATLSHPQSGEHDATDLSQKLGTISINDEEEKFPPSKPRANVFLYGGLNSPKDSSDQKAQSNGVIKPETPSFKRYMFEEMSTNDGATFASYPSLDRNFINAKMPLCSSATTPNGVHFSGMASQARNNGVSPTDLEFFIKRHHDYFPGDHQEQQQIFGMPPNAENHAFQFPPRVPFPGMEFTSSAYQQQYCFDDQSDCMAPHNSRQRNMAWQNLCYQAHIQNQGVQLHEFQNSIVSGMRSSTGSNQGSNFRQWNGNFLHDRHNGFNFSAMGSSLYQYQNQTAANGLNCSAKDFFGPQAVNRKQIFPEKILTRSDGMNSLKNLSSISNGNNQSPLVANNNRMLHYESFVQHPLGLSNGYFDLDDMNFQDSSFNINDIRGRIYIMAKDQNGCRFLQKIFAGGARADIDMIFFEIISHILELMTDPFGNYLVQKLLEVCNEDQRTRIVHMITAQPGELFRISCDTHGTRAVQKVVESLQTVEQYFATIAALKPYVIALIKDINGNHVVQRCLQYFPAEYSQFLFDTAEAHCVEIATDRQGCCVLQKCLHHSDGDRKDRLMSKIIASSLILSQDKYGNYVVQFILEQDVPWATKLLLDLLQGNLAELSVQKYSSNVVEKCLRSVEDKRRVAIILELMNSPMLLEIVQDPYGNYVIQSTLKQCKGALRAAFMAALKPHFAAMRNNIYGRRVLYSICTKK